MRQRKERREVGKEKGAKEGGEKKWPKTRIKIFTQFIHLGKTVYLVQSQDCLEKSAEDHS